MPEMRFVVEWPDGTRQDCYSPSLVMHDYLRSGARYPVPEFVQRTSDALSVASDRVLAKFGMRCTSAMQQTEEIAAVAETFDAGEVRVLSMTGRELL